MHSVVKLKLSKEYVNIVKYNTPLLLGLKKLNSLMYRTPTYMPTYTGVIINF